MVQLFLPSSERRLKEETVGVTGLHAGLAPLEGQELPSQGNPIGQSFPQEITKITTDASLTG